jgi:hypothetical protein
MTATGDLKSIAIRATKGNELMSFITEDFPAGMFQTTLANGLDANKAVRVGRTVAALGCRGDYLDLVLYITTCYASYVPAPNLAYVQMVDFTGVPTAVQHTVFGKYSPFVSPKEPMNESMMDGIDRQEMVMYNTEKVASQAACTTGKTQFVRGSLDSRITYFADQINVEDATEFNVKLDPNSDGVMLIRAGAIIWAEPDANTMDVAE